ncbi:glycoside hydrolase family 18 protein [Nocardioides sp. SYSU D00038]|uniref:glycosyl hydrolase family 18 protein n=1 Tax=Nocardioides sp. SYSU D00038 TaxID=2812554 RepID=UPI00196765BF|nr:glycoside hydrolase family 18 protein [Nocardioides sp. SYSU D00038]
MLSRIISGAAAAALLVGGLAATSSTAHAAPETRAATTQRAAETREVGTSLRLAGRVPQRVVRRVVVQVRVGSGWTSVRRARTAATGRYAVRVAVRAGVRRYRVVAPAAGRLPAYRSPVRRVVGVRQRAVLRAAASVPASGVVDVRGSFAPAVPGRRVVVERRLGQRWVRLAATTQGPGGVVAQQLRLPATATLRLRALPTRAWRERPTPPVVVRVLPEVTGDPWVTGYYAGWYWDQEYAPEEVDTAAMTHLVFGRVAPGGGSLGGQAGQVVEGAGTAHDTGTAPGGGPVEDYLVDRVHATGGKALLMLGGDGDDGDGFLRSTATPALRARFVENVVDYLVAHDYDGVDVDWENCLGGERDCGEAPGTAPVSAAAARARLMTLIADLRAETSTRARYAEESALITFPGYAVSINDLDDGKVARWQADVALAVDQYNLMSYGVGTAWSGSGWLSWFTGPIAGATDETPIDLSSSIDAYVATGVPRHRLGIGIGFFGIYYGPGVTGPRQDTEDNDTFETDDNALSYSELHRKGYLSHGVLGWDVVASSTYRSYPGGGYRPEVDPGASRAGFLSYEDERSIAAKGEWVRDTGIGGTILWTVNYGALPDGSNPLLDAVEAAFLD